MRAFLRIAAFLASAIATGFNHEMAGHLARAAVDGAIYGAFTRFFGSSH